MLPSGMPKQQKQQEWADEKIVTATFGITHTPLYNLRKSGAIRSVSLRVEGQKYGKRLYHIPSIVEFLAGQEAREIQENRAKGRKSA
jgi:hypothetical protein